MQKRDRFQEGSWDALGSIFGPFWYPRPTQIASWGVLGSSWEPQGAQEAPKRGQEAPKSFQRAAQEAPKTLQEASWGPRWRPFSLKKLIQNRGFRLALFWKCFLKRFC